MLKQVGLDESALACYPLDLTASEQQRVGIARALVTRPDLVVLDEPTSMLDPSARAELLALLQQIQRETGTAYIFISHDLTSVARISHRIAIMYLGHIVEQAPTKQILQRQYHPYSRALLSAVLFADPRQQPMVLRPPYAAFAEATPPPRLWAALVDGDIGERQRILPTLAHYDFIVFIDKRRVHVPPSQCLGPIFERPSLQIFAVLHDAGCANS